MNKLRVNRYHFSRLFWNVILHHSEAFLHDGWSKLRNELYCLERHRKSAAYNTGSINLSAAFVLYALCNYFRPKSAAEVGTFIGKSTLSMARAMEGTDDASIHTCDYSNDIDLELPTSVKIFQHKRKSSTDMFNHIKQAMLQIDLLALDGRLSNEDLGIIKFFTHSNTIVVLDDFEGVEKGVANTHLLLNNPQFKNHFLLYPPEITSLRPLSFLAGCTTAVLLPLSLIAYTPQ
jgi:hypothetical protein